MNAINTNEARLMAAEDARQLLTSITLLEEEIALAEEQGRFVTADRLRGVLDRTEALYRRLCGVEDEGREISGIERGLRFLFELPLVVLTAIGGLLARKPAPVAVACQEPDVTVVCRACSVPVADPQTDFCTVCNPAVPVAGLAPTLLLTFTPIPKAKRTPRKPKPKAMPAAARTTAEPLYVRRGRRYVEAAKGKPEEQKFRRVQKGKRVRYLAA